MESKLGVQQVSEALEAIMELALAFASLAKDGVQLSDLPALYAKMQLEPLKGKLVAAADRVGEVPKEVADIDLVEGMQLAMVALPYVPKFIEALRK